MERGVVRAVVILALVLFLAGDFAALFTPVLHMVGVGQTHKADGLVEETNELDNLDHKESAESIASQVTKSSLMATIRNSCLPKLICELNATPHREKLSDSEKSLLSLIRDTSISTTAEVTSKYHFAAHMGQLIAGVEGTGCHNFYPSCPFPGLQVLQMMKKVKLR